MNLQAVRDQIEFLYGPPLHVVSDLIRATLCAQPEHILVSCDYSQIEARIVAWLAGQDDILEVFRTHGLIYEHTASQIYGVSLEEIVAKGKDSDERFIGKVGTLSLGFGGAVGAFVAMAKNHGKKVSETRAKSIVKAWRERNKKIVAYWKELEDAAFQAVSCPGVKFYAGAKGRQVYFVKKGSLLVCKLLSGRFLFFPYPRIENVEFPFPHEAVTYKIEQKGQWIRIPGWGGLFAENITQATARDIMKEGMFLWEENGFEIVFHVHDEVISEVKESDETKAIELAEELLVKGIPWSAGLPVAVSGWKRRRYCKG